MALIYSAPPLVQRFPRGFIFGLTMSNDPGDTVNDIAVAAGSAAAEGVSAGDMILASAITKRLDAAWAVGTGNGGLNTGVEANSTWYEVHLIKRVDTGVVDVMFTTTANRATLPANYTLQRRIGWIRNDSGSTILAFTQIDDHFTLTTQVNDVSLSFTATAAQVTLTVPPSSIARFRATTDVTALNVGLVLMTVFSEVAEGNVTPSELTGIGSIGSSGQNSTAATNDWGDGGHFELRVDASSQIEHDTAVGTGGAGTFDISTFGWIDRRGRLS
jgi:hypothetical protein